jgi:ABC-2 type transport system permease protein
MVPAGGAIVYPFWLILATLSFWFVRVENILVIFQSVEAAWPELYRRGCARADLLVPVASP